MSFGLLILSVCAFAQTEEPPKEGYKYIDTVIYNAVPRLNESLVGKSVGEILPWRVKLHQSPSIKSAADAQVRKNKTVQTDGFRIRIYFDNKQNSREASFESESRFKRLFPGYNTYRTFKNPYFKVTVGDFRTKADAQVALQRIPVQHIHGCPLRGTLIIVPVPAVGFKAVDFVVCHVLISIADTYV